MNKLLIKLINSFYPHFSQCHRCGRNWGWTKWVSHPTTTGGSLFLFCVDCDKVVTPQERWDALDKWKADCLVQLRKLSEVDTIRTREEKRKILSTELTQFPRKESK